MLSREKFMVELDLAWDNTSIKSSRFLLEESTENDTGEILLYLDTIVETALKRQSITEEQWSLCKSNLSKASSLLEGKKAVPYLKQNLKELSVKQLLQSLLMMSDAGVLGMLALANQSEEKYVELNAGGDDLICFLYKPVNPGPTFYDRYAKHALPVNGHSDFCCYDNYFPLYKLLEKHFPRTTIRLVTDKKQAVGRYIYVVAFKQFPDFAAKRTGHLLSVIPEDVLDDCRNDKAIIVYNDLGESMYYPPIIESFTGQIKDAGIVNSFFLLSGDWSNDVLLSTGGLLQKFRSIFGLASGSVNFYIANFFEEAMAYSKLTYHPEYTFETKLNSIKGNAIALRHFICLSRTVKDYRLYLSYFFYSHGLMDKAYISQDNYAAPKDFEFGYDQNASLLKVMTGPKFEAFKQLLPLHIDYTDMKNYVWDGVPLDAVNNSFCWVTTETSFGRTLPNQSFRLTEKTYKPIAYFMPFIMAGNPFLLKRLHENGYQTFSKWWDESYDAIMDPIERMEKITEVLLKISRLSQLELVSIYEEMKPVLLHNYEILTATKSAKEAMEAILKASTAK